MAERMVILQSMDMSLAMQDISVYVFRPKLERFLHPLLGATSLEEAAMQQLVCTLMGDWKLMVVPPMHKYVSVAQNVKGTIGL